MSSQSYFDFIYEVDGETIKLRPDKIFEPKGVYLIIDKDLKLIWIWAGSHSRLFHRYMAANWAGKLKTKKNFFNFKYEVIKQGIEPSAFHVIFNEIKENNTHLNYPGESRKFVVISDYTAVKPELKISGSTERKPYEVEISHSVKNRIRKILSEIKEMQDHLKYSIEHIQQRYEEIEKLLEK
ncbi:MAG TPA: hypothetical protein ENH75_09010 [archaeon]|nr:hypothetical protein [archaeon]